MKLDTTLMVSGLGHYFGKSDLNPRRSEKTLSVPEAASALGLVGLTSSIPWMGVNARLDAIPFVEESSPPPPCFAHLSCACLGTFSFDGLAVSRSLAQ